MQILILLIIASTLVGCPPGSLANVPSWRGNSFIIGPKFSFPQFLSAFKPRDSKSEILKYFYVVNDLALDFIGKLKKDFALKLPDTQKWVELVSRQGRERIRNEPLSVEDNQFVALIDKHNDKALEMLLNVFHSSDGWSIVSEGSDIKVERRSLPAGPFVNSIDAAKSAKHACVRSTAVLNAKSDDVFDLFTDAARTRDYNSHCENVMDVLHIPNVRPHKWSKVSYATGPRIGPFKARDFCSVVQYIKYGNGTSVILNRPAYLSRYSSNNNYVRATVLLGGNIIEPISKSQTRVTMIAHINPGGGADTQAAAWMINQLCAIGPPQFLKKVEKCANTI